MSWIVLFGLLLAIFPTVLVLLWLLHQKGLFDPLYDCWEDHFPADNQRVDIRKHGLDVDRAHIHLNKHHKKEARHRKHDAHKRRSSHDHSERDTDYYNYLHHVHKDKHKHRRQNNGGIILENENVGHHRRRNGRDSIKPLSRMASHSVVEKQDEFNKHKIGPLDDAQFKAYAKRRE